VVVAAPAEAEPLVELDDLEPVPGEAAASAAAAQKAWLEEAVISRRRRTRVASIIGGAVLLIASVVLAVVLTRSGPEPAAGRVGPTGGAPDGAATVAATVARDAGPPPTSQASRRPPLDLARAVTAADAGAPAISAVDAAPVVTPAVEPAHPAKPAGDVHVAAAHRKRVPVVVDYEPPAPRRRPEKVAPAPAPKPSPGPTPTTTGPDLEAAREAYRHATQRYWYGDFGAAEALYRKSLAAYPGYAAGYRGLGLLYARRGDNKRAVDAYNRYLRMAPGARDAGQIRERLGKLHGE
jgi:TolA-binding protein